MRSPQDIVIGIDASTTACKAIAWDPCGNSIAEARSSIAMQKSRTGWHEQSAEDWWMALQIALQETAKQIDTLQIAGICICPQRETFVPVDESGRPLRTAIVWMDERARDLLPTIEAHFDPKIFHQSTGKPLSANLTMAKILWIRENEPAVFEYAAKFVDVAAYLNYKLTGEFATSWGIADPTGIFDIQQQEWSALIIDFLGLKKNQLPAAHAPGTIIGRITSETAQICGLPAALPVIAGLGDGQAAGLGANITGSGQAYLSLGTSVVSGTYTESYVTDRAFRTMVSIPGAYSLETVLLGGSYTISWFQENFAGGRSFVDLEREVNNIPTGSDGLMLVPYWNSVMNPYWDANASGITIGWRGHHGPAHLYRAILEGIAFELRLHFEGVESALKKKIEHLTVMGGGSQSDLWCQIITDITGKTIQRAHIPEATALGAGILAAAGSGLFPSVRQATTAMTRPPESKFFPNEKEHQIYTQLFEHTFRKIYPALKPVFQ